MFIYKYVNYASLPPPPQLTDQNSNQNFEFLGFVTFWRTQISPYFFWHDEPCKFYLNLFYILHI